MQGRRGEVSRLGHGFRDPELVDIRQQLHPQTGAVGHEQITTDGRLARRPAAVLGRVVLVVRERAAVAQRAQIVREASTRRMEVEVAHLRVAVVPEPVDNERRHVCERPRRHEDRLVLDAEPHGQLTVEDVEEIGVVVMDVQVCADGVRPEPRPRRMQRLVVRQDLDAPVGRIADQLALAGQDEDGSAHECAV